MNQTTKKHLSNSQQQISRRICHSNQHPVILKFVQSINILKLIYSYVRHSIKNQFLNIIVNEKQFFSKNDHKQ